MNQTEYEEMFREEENAPAEAATSTEAQNQKVPEQNHDTTEPKKKPIFDPTAVSRRILESMGDVVAYALKHQRFSDIAWHLEQIRRILEGEK